MSRPRISQIPTAHKQQVLCKHKLKVENYLESRDENINKPICSKKSIGGNKVNVFKVVTIIYSTCTT